MKQKCIRWVDRYPGRVICFLLTLWRYVADRCKPKCVEEAPSNILFIKLIEQGSITAAYPALKKAVDMCGEKNVYFLVFNENRPILDILDVVEPGNIIEIATEGWGVFLLSLWRAFFRIRRAHVQAAVDMEFFSRFSAIFSYLSGARIRVGLHRFNDEGPYRGDLLTHRLIDNPYIHIRLFFLSLVKAALEMPANKVLPQRFVLPHDEGISFHFTSSDEERKNVIKKLEHINKSPLTGPVILLNPKLKDQVPVRRWPRGSFVQLGKKIHQDMPDATIFITGDGREQAESIQLARDIGKAHSCAGYLALRELLVLYTIANALITTDSGPVHFASLTELPVIVLFGPETPLLYAPQQDNIHVLSQPYVCSPCLNVINHRLSPCNEPLCVHTISVEKVYDNLREILH